MTIQEVEGRGLKVITVWLAPWAAVTAWLMSLALAVDVALAEATAHV